jgi:hypothetical protein
MLLSYFGLPQLALGRDQNPPQSDISKFICYIDKEMMESNIVHTYPSNYRVG